MLKHFLAALLALFAMVAMAAVDANKGSAAELDSVKGIGPALSGKIVEARKKGDFKDWTDMISRVSGIGEKSATKLSEAGLTVNGQAYKDAAAPAAKADDKKAAKSAKKSDAAASAAKK